MADTLPCSARAKFTLDMTSGAGPVIRKGVLS